jgi:hypothetical protein
MMVTNIVFSSATFVLLILGVVAITLQVFLSKTDNKWVGLIMPIVPFCISLGVALRILFQGADSRTFTGMINGELVTHIPSTSGIIGESIIMFAIWNVLTGILVAIYLVCRKRRSRQRALLKMSVQDL